MFEVIPAIDLLGGKCVRLHQGKYAEATEYSNAPIEMAKKWESLGACRLHVVDLDGAKTGTPENISIIKEIISAIKIPVQIGGGIRTSKLMEELLNHGADRIILSTSAVSNPNLLSSLLPRFGKHIVISVDVKDNKIAIRGWQKMSNLKPTVLAKEAVKAGIQRFIYTDITRDGTLVGPNLEAAKTFAEEVKVPVIVAGGMSSKKDVENVKALEASGIEGCIIGKALYTGSIKLEEVL